MTDPCWSLHRVGKVFFLKPQGHVYKADQNRNLQERSDDSGKRLAGVDSEDGHGNNDMEFKIVGCCGEA